MDPQLEVWKVLTILLLIFVSVAFLLFLLLRLWFRKILSSSSRQRIRIFSWLTSIILTIFIVYFIGGMIRPPIPDFEDFLEGWEIKTTYQVYPSKVVSIVDRRHRLDSGEKDVLIVLREVSPILKEGEAEVADLESYRTLIIELNSADSVISPKNPGSSRMFREILSMSPDYGTHPIGTDEKIEIRKIGIKKWYVSADLSDFKFNGEFSFADSSRISNTYLDLYSRE